MAEQEGGHGWGRVRGAALVLGLAGLAFGIGILDWLDAASAQDPLDLQLGAGRLLPLVTSSGPDAIVELADSGVAGEARSKPTTAKLDFIACTLDPMGKRSNSALTRVRRMVVDPASARCSLGRGPADERFIHLSFDIVEADRVDSEIAEFEIYAHSVERDPARRVTVGGHVASTSEQSAASAAPERRYTVGFDLLAAGAYDVRVVYIKDDAFYKPGKAVRDIISDQANKNKTDWRARMPPRDWRLLAYHREHLYDRVRVNVTLPRGVPPLPTPAELPECPSISAPISNIGRLVGTDWVPANCQFRRFSRQPSGRKGWDRLPNSTRVHMLGDSNYQRLQGSLNAFKPLSLDRQCNKKGYPCWKHDASGGLFAWRFFRGITDGDRISGVLAPEYFGQAANPNPDGHVCGRAFELRDHWGVVTINTGLWPLTYGRDDFFPKFAGGLARALRDCAENQTEWRRRARVFWVETTSTSFTESVHRWRNAHNSRIERWETQVRDSVEALVDGIIPAHRMSILRRGNPEMVYQDPIHHSGEFYQFLFEVILNYAAWADRNVVWKPTADVDSGRVRLVKHFAFNEEGSGDSVDERGVPSR